MKLRLPNWNFDHATYERTAASFDNPDFVPIVIHPYCHALVPRDPAVEKTERQLAAQPRISVPTAVLDGGGDGVIPSGASERHERFFSRKYKGNVILRVGHNLPQEAPQELAAAVLSVV